MLQEWISNYYKQPWEKPTHGNCCTCQTCGWDHDSCKCSLIYDVETPINIIRNNLKAKSISINFDDEINVELYFYGDPPFWRTASDKELSIALWKVIQEMSENDSL